jgi:hypothetical protein
MPVAGGGLACCPIVHAGCSWLEEQSLLCSRGSRALVLGRWAAGRPSTKAPGGLPRAGRSQGQVSVAASSALAAEALSERYRDLRALLRLLTRLTQADWAAAAPDADGGGAPNGDTVDVAEVGADAGISVLLPSLPLNNLTPPPPPPPSHTLVHTYTHTQKSTPHTHACTLPKVARMVCVDHTTCIPPASRLCLRGWTCWCRC